MKLDLEKTYQLGESSPKFIFAAVNFDPIGIEKRWTGGESWPNDFVEKVKRWRLEVGRFKMPFDACINTDAHPNKCDEYYQNTSKRNIFRSLFFLSKQSSQVTKLDVDWKINLVKTIEVCMSVLLICSHRIMSLKWVQTVHEFYSNLNSRKKKSAIFEAKKQNPLDMGSILQKSKINHIWR